MNWTLNEIQHLVFTEYMKNGYYDMWELEGVKQFLIEHEEVEVYKQLQIMADVAEAGLINTEVSELLEAIRKQNKIENPKEEWGLECADIVIRVLNFCSRKNINVCDYIVKKHEVNLQREKLHGNVV